MNPEGYVVTLLTSTCAECTSSNFQEQLTCTQSECQFLCYHMYTCDSRCYAYTNRHICKHIHRVHSLNIGAQVPSALLADTGNDMSLQPQMAVKSDDDEMLAYAESTRTHSAGKLLFSNVKDNSLLIGYVFSQYQH